MYVLNSGQRLTEQKIKEAIILEVLSKDGRLYSHLKYIYDISIERAAFSAVLKSILNILANQDGLNQSQIARKLKSGQGAVRNYLRSLEEVDLVFRQENKYYIKDNFLRYWIYYQERGVELLGLPKQKELKNLIKELEEKFSRVSAKLGIAKEAEIRELLGKMQGKVFNSELFGLAGEKIRIPKFSSFGRYQDTVKEIDILASNKQTWAVEIKWRNEVLDKNALQNFKKKIKADRYWFISKSGFSEPALKYAKRIKMLISEQGDVQRIKKTIS
jgi:DNA-binding MarR family transcriptional regulator/Holliday junction resolvase-like predicted endonuclease